MEIALYLDVLCFKKKLKTNIIVENWKVIFPLSEHFSPLALHNPIT